jgi:nucleoside-diphosphate-sugar epimerase
MKILVTGGLGFIGHNVVALLEQQGHELIVTDTRTTYGIVPQDQLAQLVAERRGQIATDRIYGIDISDLAGIDWLIGLHQPQVIIHLASFPRQKVVNSNPMLGSRSMSEGLLNLLEASVKHHVQKFVYVSSSMVYGNFKDIYFDGVDESHATRPIGQYGIMKLAGEWLVQDYTRRTGLEHVIVRPSAVYGPRDVEDRVISRFLITAMQNGIIQVNGADEELDFTHVTDAATGIAQATTSTTSQNRVYNLTRSRGRTLLEAAQLACKIAGAGTIQINLPDNTFPSRGQLNIMQARQDFDYHPTIDIEQGFQDYYEWLKNSVYGIKKTI